MAQILLLTLKFTVIALVLGIGMSSTPADNRTVLAVCSATRHVGIAVIAAAALPGPGPAVRGGFPHGEIIVSPLVPTLEFLSNRHSAFTVF